LVASAADLPPEHVEFFETKIRPILADHCYKCHSTESGKSKADLLLDTRDALRKGGATGAAIIPGDPRRASSLRPCATAAPISKCRRKTTAANSPPSKLPRSNGG
jgi:hypothetical protein